MKKKVIDILPPKELAKSAIKGLEREERPKIKKPEFRIPSFPLGKKILTLGLFVLFLIFIFCFFSLSKTNIEVWPETETLTLETNLTIDKTVGEANFSAKVIPGEIFEKEKTITENFPSSGRLLKETKAEGIIKVYNEHSTYSQVLVVTTRFISAEGKLFRTPTNVTIPGGRYEKGKLIPGEIDIRVVADKAGPAYNIEPSTFSIPGFAGTDKYTKFYAKSFQSMIGGFSQEVFQVTEKDLKEAQDSLTKKAKEESENSLKNELGREEVSFEYKFLEEAIQTEIVETFSLAKAGNEVENFNFQVKAKSKTLIFKKEDVENFVKEFISSQITKGKKLYQESLKIDFLPESINLNAGKIILSLEISAKIYSDINTAALKNGLREKSLMETKVFLENQPGVTKVKVEFWPFWVKKVPEDLDKINFNLIVD